MYQYKRLINGFKRQNRNTIWKHLEALAENHNIYSEHLTGIRPYLTNCNIYLYIYHTSMVLVCLDVSGKTEELADEDDFNDSAPLYFSAEGSRVSPVWQLAEQMKIVRQKMFDANQNWPMWGVLLTESHFVNADDMKERWEEMHITVIDQLEHLCREVPVNMDEDLESWATVNEAIGSILQHEDDTISDKELKELLDKLILEASDDDDDDEDDDDDDDNDDDENEDEEDDEDDDEEKKDDELPSGIIAQNSNTTVMVKVLPPLADPQAELDKLVGCQDVKARIDELLALTRYNKMVRDAFPNAKLHKVSLHSIFFGRPGTGKTTVCKIFGSLLHKVGALSKGHVVVADRRTFIGSLWGDEERSVHQALEQAKGGVLMIDEAYLLNGKHDHDPGKMVLQLLMEMLADETQRDIAVVLCGYKEPMMSLLETNPGLHSRFPNRFEFNDFTVDELMEITRRRISEYQYHFTPHAWKKYRKVLDDAYQVRDPQSWGNARFVANQLDRIFIRHAQRCVKEHPANGKRLLTLTPADITPIEVARSRPRIGF